MLPLSFQHLFLRFVLGFVLAAVLALAIFFGGLQLLLLTQNMIYTLTH